MSYGDNKANKKRVTLHSCKTDASTLDMCIYEDMKHTYTKEDVLALAELSQNLTDKLNALYEQMKG